MTVLAPIVLVLYWVNLNPNSFFTFPITVRADTKVPFCAKSLSNITTLNRATIVVIKFQNLNIIKTYRKSFFTLTSQKLDFSKRLLWIHVQWFFRFWSVNVILLSFQAVQRSWAFLAILNVSWMFLSFSGLKKVTNGGKHSWNVHVNSRNA